MMKYSSRSAVPTLFSLVLVGGALPSCTTEPSDPGAETLDLEQQAQELVEYSEEEQQASATAAQLAEQYPDEFAGAFWSQGVVWIRFVGEPPEAAAVTATSAGARVIAGAQRRTLDAQAAIDRLMPRLVAEQPEVQGVGYDIRTEEYFVDVLRPKAGDDRPLKLPEDLEGARIEWVDAPFENDRYGGLDTTSCTTGFTATTPGGTRGLLTAGHCTGSGLTQDFRFFSSSTWNPTNHYSCVDSQLADAAFRIRPAGGAIDPSFHAESTVTRRTNAIGAALAGMIVCHRGKTTGHSCGVVTSTTYAPSSTCGTGSCAGSSNQPCAAVFGRVSGSGLKCWGGDSGGPVYWAGANNTGAAIGIFKGSSKTGPGAGQCNHAVYTNVNMALYALGLTLLEP